MRGLGSSAGINFVLKDLNGLGHEALIKAKDDVIAASRQVPTIMSIGASARDIRTLEAIMPPGESWPSITSKAPAPKASDCCE